MSEKFSAQNTNKIVAVFIATFFTEDSVQNIKLLTSTLPDRGYKPVFFSTLDDLYANDLETEGERQIFHSMDISRFDAVILFSESFKRDDDMISVIKKANEAHVPVITVSKYLPGTNANINFEHEIIFGQVCDHMLTCHDYKNIFFLAGPEHNSTSDERISVFLDECKKHSYAFDMNHLYYGGFWARPCKKCLDEIFSKAINGSDVLPDCIVCANDAMAFEVIRYANEHGLKVPDDIAVSGFDGIPLEKYCNPRLTTGALNLKSFAEKIGDALEALSSSPDSQLGNISISSTLQIGRSCGCKSELMPHDYSFDYVALRNNLTTRLQYEHEVSQMVIESFAQNEFSNSLAAIPGLIGTCNIQDFDFVANKSLVDSSALVFSNANSAELYDSTCFTTRLCDFNISPKASAASYTAYDLINYGDICSDINVKLNSKYTLLCTPVHSDGNCVGYTVAEFDPEAFLYDFYSAFTMNFTHMISNQIHQMRLMKTYMIDSLTGLYNRNGFYCKFDDYCTTHGKSCKLSIISMDMDGLKTINDTYGHAEGDKALAEFGKFILNSTGYQLAARMGGDEFIIAVFGNDSEQVAEQVINNIKLQISYRNSHTPGSYPLHASIAGFTADLSEHSLDYFMKNADRLMYQRKKIHKERCYS